MSGGPLLLRIPTSDDLSFQSVVLGNTEFLQCITEHHAAFVRGFMKHMQRMKAISGRTSPISPILVAEPLSFDALHTLTNSDRPVLIAAVKPATTATR